MTLIADFNLEDEKGRIPIPVDARAVLQVGDLVLVADKEGNRCKAVVAELSLRGEAGNATLVAFVVPKPGTWERPA